MTASAVARRLARLHAAAPIRRLNKDDRLVVISDLHMGDGGRVDDFRHNGALVEAALRHHYLPQGFHLILNGDIEELQRFRAPRVRAQWHELLQLFSEFSAGSGLTRLIGNHDMSPEPLVAGMAKAGQALRLVGDGGEIFVFHGHQAALYGPAINRLLGWILRWIASPLGIRNYTVAFNSRRKYRYEQRVYQFARSHHLLAMIGHTHRPLFESISRLDTLKMRIEAACRDFARQPEPQLAAEIHHMKSEFFTLTRSPGKYAGQSMLYHQGLLVPCLFNSGSAIGPGGVTALEIDRGIANLALWFHSSRNRRYLQVEERHAVRLENTDIHRVPLKTEDLNYIQTRIRLLS
ncbi:MAG: hypothetical protein RB296_03580 [Acidobacteriota bacterium]|jgi:UDP-2,3-diacylglucosamine pyrophosphatase LpxH|nr:hypothetical protein [Acidobacteriota bacterium]